jgi:hypothetical protein
MNTLARGGSSCEGGSQVGSGTKLTGRPQTTSVGSNPSRDGSEAFSLAFK